MKDVIRREVKRLGSATRFSLQGLRQAWLGEAAFRFEVLLAIVLLSAAMLVPISRLERIALVASVFLVLIVELLNSAVEAVVDRIGPDHHPLSGQAKDLGSAAVFLALLLALFVWLSILGGALLAT